MTRMTTQHTYDQYIDRITEIRSLSTPSLSGISNAEDYSTRLRENFTRIGLLASENRSFLDDTLFPLIRSDRKLSDMESDDLNDFCDKFLNAEVMEALDPVITSMVADRLADDSKSKGEFQAQISNLDIQMSTIYTIMNITERITEYPEISMEYRRKGFDLGNYFISLRQHDRFRSIPDAESREIVLTNARFTSAFYENLCGDPDQNSNDIRLLEESLAISEDPFYKPLVPDFDWGYYRFRMLEYYAETTDYCNSRGFNSAQLSQICSRTEELWELWHDDPDQYGEYDKEELLQLFLVRNRFLAGKMTEDEYLNELFILYGKRDKSDYEIGSAAENVLTPAEIMCVFEHRHLTEADKTLIGEIYNDIVNYVFLMPNSGALSFMLEYISYFLQHFIEIPEGVHFEDIMLDLLAAFHPPTYVHSNMVAHFTACLAGHLIDSDPELFTGVCGLGNVEEVKAGRDKIIDFAYHAALCHDAGKLFIIDTVFVYGRRLEDMEFDLIKTHPKMGAAILSRYASTASYAEIALGHHRWYDNSKGYPEGFNTSDSSLKTVIDLVTCADCLDAATDTIGRSYSHGKTIDEFITELEEGSGTSYAPWLAGLVSREEVRADLEYLLKEGRERNYRNTYHLLKDVHEKTYHK